VIEAETCCHLVTLNKINIHNTSCVLTCESLLLFCISICSVTYFRKSYRLWDNVEMNGRAGRTTGGNITSRMHIDNWGHTLTICNIYCFSTATLVTRTCLNVTLYVLCLSFFIYGPYLPNISFYFLSARFITWNLPDTLVYLTIARTQRVC